MHYHTRSLCGICIRGGIKKVAFEAIIMPYQDIVLEGGSFFRKQGAIRDLLQSRIFTLFLYKVSYLHVEPFQITFIYRKLVKYNDLQT